MKIFVFGSSITSSYWNGAATYYRGIYKQLHHLGHQITFAEPDVYGRQQNRDATDLFFVRCIVYRSAAEIPALLQRAQDAGLIIKHSGVGAFDEMLERAVVACRTTNTKVAFWDVDSPATLARMEGNPNDPLRRLVREYDFIFSYGGGEAAVDGYLRLGAANCHPVYNALDPETHYPVPPDAALQCDLAFIGHRLPDRERRVEEFFLRAARLAPELRFVLGGEGWKDKPLPGNVRWIGHVGTHDHNRVNCSARMVLNINRASMAHMGFSPPTRIFEAAGAGACVMTDEWAGIESFFAPGREILVAASAEDVVRHLRASSSLKTATIGHNMRRRALRDHTYGLRAEQFDSIVTQSRVLNVSA